MFSAGAFTVEQEQAQLTCLEADCESTGQEVCMEEAKRAWRDRRASRRNGRSAKPAYSDWLRKKYCLESEERGSNLVNPHMVCPDAFNSSMGLDTDRSLGWAFLEKVDSSDSEYSPSVSPRILEEAATDKGLVVWGAAN